MAELFAKYNHADMLVTLAIVALIFFAYRSPTVDLSSFGMGIGTILGGRGAHAWGVAQGQS